VAATASSPATAGPIIEARGLVKRYGGFTAVNGVDLVVETGEVFGILGPNGAGKTTTLEMIEGLRPPSEGTIQVAGIDAVRNSAAVRKIIGVQLQTTALFDYLSATELVSLFGNLYGRNSSTEQTSSLLAMVGLEEKQKARVSELSGGQQQRLSIALALVNQPKVVFLDEPTTGLDPQARRTLWATVQEINAAGTTVVLTTHYMEEAEFLCDRIAIMDRGQVIALDTPAALIRNLAMEATIRARIADGAVTAADLAGLDAASSATLTDGVVQIETADAQASLVALLDLARSRGVTLAELSTSQANLEDVFLQLTGRQYDREEDTAGQAAD
jgi:ABC-2 type transport system ATP-binding protein